MSPLERDKQFRIRLTGDELLMLHALAEREGISAADFLRLHVRKAYAQAFGDRKPSKKPTK